MPIVGCALDKVLGSAACGKEVSGESEEEVFDQVEGATLKYVMSQSNLVEKHGYDASLLDQEVSKTTSTISEYFKQNPQFKGMLVLSTAYLPSYGKPQVLKVESFKGLPYAPRLQSQFKDIENHIKCNKAQFCNLWLQMSVNFKGEEGEDVAFDVKDFAAFFASKDLGKYEVYPSKKVDSPAPELVFFVYAINGHEVSKEEVGAFFGQPQLKK